MNLLLKRGLTLGCAAIALCSTLVVAQNAPESLLPPGFDDPAPRPAPSPNPQAPPNSRTTPAPRPPATTSREVVQPIPASPRRAPSGDSASSTSSVTSADGSPNGLPSLRELENLDPDALDELLGLKPKFDIPPQSRRSLEQIGILSEAEGGLPARSLANQPGAIVRASLAGIKGPMISRWGHILLRRALVSRLDAPTNMDPVEFAALRTATLNNLGEHSAARAIAQGVDTANWNAPLIGAALDAYIGTSDILGACPAVQVKGDALDTPQWGMVRDICYAFSGQADRSQTNLKRTFRRGELPQIDVLLAQRFAGTAGRGRRAINLEWDDVDSLTPWRFSLANALGAEIPDNLLTDAEPYYQSISATAPMLSIERRISGADEAARRGNLSSAAMVDLYSQLYAEQSGEGEAALTAARLRDAYIAPAAAQRLAAIRDVWGGAERDYGRYVLTAYAAARVTPNAELEDTAADLIASMLTAGLDADAMTWAPLVADGSLAWALLAVARPDTNAAVSEGDVDDYVGQDDSSGQRKSKFLVAGLAGLERIDASARDSLAQDLGEDLTRRTKWSALIGRAADVQNAPLVAYLAGLGMQGTGWDTMSPRHLYHIVGALNRVGLRAEARMIAAEAVARG